MFQNIWNHACLIKSEWRIFHVGCSREILRWEAVDFGWRRKTWQDLDSFISIEVYGMESVCWMKSGLIWQHPGKFQQSTRCLTIMILTGSMVMASSSGDVFRKACTGQMERMDNLLLWLRIRMRLSQWLQHLSPRIVYWILFGRSCFRESRIKRNWKNQTVMKS